MENFGTEAYTVFLVNLVEKARYYSGSFFCAKKFTKDWSTRKAYIYLHKQNRIIMKNKAQKGPYIVAKNGVSVLYQFSILAEYGGRSVADVYRRNWPKDKSTPDPIAEDTANLLAASWDMKKALEETLLQLNTLASKMDVVPSRVTLAKEKAEAALAYANTGERNETILGID